MARYEERLWPGDPAGQTRRDREPFRYQAYVPDEIGEAEFPMPGPVAQAVSDSERAVADLNREPPAVHTLEAVARQLLRAESVASSRIEGLELSHKRLARADFQQEASRDETARSVLGNIHALERAIELGESVQPFGVDDLCDIHATLISATRDAHTAGRLRDRQNWLGGSTFSPRGAEFIPPPPEYVGRLLEDLAAFINRTDLPAVQQAAIAHAQFETIHPFADGNGRVGRCLIHTILRRRRLAQRYVPPISVVLATAADDYIKELTAYRDDREREWTLFFAQATSTSARAAAAFAGRVADLQGQWRSMVGRLRKDSAAARLIEELPRMPIVDTATAHQLLGGSDEAVRLALRRLEDAGVITRLRKSNGRGHAWEAVGLFEALDGFERDLATPDGMDDPSRPSPRTPAPG
jgi:Fic family protein